MCEAEQQLRAAWMEGRCLLSLEELWDFLLFAHVQRLIVALLSRFLNYKDNKSNFWSPARIRKTLCIFHYVISTHRELLKPIMSLHSVTFLTLRFKINCVLTMRDMLKVLFYPHVCPTLPEMNSCDIIKGWRPLISSAAASFLHFEHRSSLQRCCNCFI